MSAAPPRLLYWAEVLLPSIGGIETFSHGLLPRLAARGYVIDVLTDDMDGTLPSREDIDGATFHRLPLRRALEANDPGLLLDNIARVRALLRETPPDLVHLNFSGPIAFYHLKAKASTPLIVTLHGQVSSLRGGGGTLAGDIFSASRWIIANSNAVLADARAWAPGIEDRSSVIYCGVEPGHCVGRAEAGGPPHLVCAGRLMPEKGFDLAVAAFAAVRRRFPGARLTVAGDGPERPALERQAAALELTDGIDFLGPVDPGRMPALLAGATLVVMPSRWQEPFGLVAVEAALQERPVLAADVGGLREVVEDGVTGRLVPGDDSGALANAAIAMLSDRPALAVMGARARERARRLFSLDASVDAIDALYRRISGTA